MSVGTLILVLSFLLLPLLYTGFKEVSQQPKQEGTRSVTSMFLFDGQGTPRMTLVVFFVIVVFQGIHGTLFFNILYDFMSNDPIITQPFWVQFPGSILAVLLLLLLLVFLFSVSGWMVMYSFHLLQQGMQSFFTFKIIIPLMVVFFSIQGCSMIYELFNP